MSCGDRGARTPRLATVLDGAARGLLRGGVHVLAQRPAGAGPEPVGDGVAVDGGAAGGGAGAVRAGTGRAWGDVVLAVPDGLAGALGRDVVGRAAVPPPSRAETMTGGSVPTCAATCVLRVGPAVLAFTCAVTRGSPEPVVVALAVAATVGSATPEPLTRVPAATAACGPPAPVDAVVWTPALTVGTGVDGAGCTVTDACTPSCTFPTPTWRLAPTPVPDAAVPFEVVRDADVGVAPWMTLPSDGSSARAPAGTAASSPVVRTSPHTRRDAGTRTGRTPRFAIRLLRPITLCPITPSGLPTRPADLSLNVHKLT